MTGLRQAENQLEALVDAFGLKQVLGLLANVAFDKAEHVAHAWQDSPLASAWNKQGKRLDAFACKTNGVPPIG